MRIEIIRIQRLRPDGGVCFKGQTQKMRIEILIQRFYHQFAHTVSKVKLKK